MEDVEEVEWVETHEWEDVNGACEGAASELADSVEVHLEGSANDDKKTIKRRGVPTKEEKAYHADMHRIHLLCLTARAHMHDQVADSEEVQALVLSLVDPRFLLHTRNLNTSSIVNNLRHTLDWFNRTFEHIPIMPTVNKKLSALASKHSATATAAAATAAAAAAAAAVIVVDSDDEQDVKEEAGIRETVEKGLRERRGHSEVLVVLFVAMLRSQGVHARFVSLLDPLPMEPWRKVVRAIRIQDPKVMSNDKEKDLAANELLLHKSKQDQQGQMEEAPGGVPGGVPGGPLRQESPSEEACPEEGGPRTGLGPRSGGSPCEEGGSGMGAHVAPAAGVSVTTSGTKRKKAAPRGKGGKSGTKAAARKKGSDAVEEVEEEEKPVKKNRGDEELERELQMALMATAAEAASKRKSAGERSCPSSGAACTSASGTLGRGNARLKMSALFKSSSGGKRKAPPAWPSGAAGRQPGNGPSWATSNPGGSCSCWAEVYCGDASTGRWVHVDVVGGYVDRPDIVDASAVRTAPVAHVLAFEGGGVKDVTARYSSSMLTVQKVRDTLWWAELMTVLDRTSAVHNDKAAQAVVPKGPPEKYGKSSTKEATLSGPTGAGPSGPGPSSAGRAEANHDQHAVSNLHRREDAELRQREDEHMKSRPTTLEGYKASPVWALKRHITKYQALRPGARPAGMHKGEAVFLRSDISELHTADRWLREGRRVRDDQVGHPFKVVKKRAQPAPRDSYSRPGFPFGGRGRGGGGRGGKEQATMEAPVEGSISVSIEQLQEEKEEEEEEGGGLGSSEEGPTTSLYGQWQTDRYRAAAVDGKVPKNSRGNVEVPPFTSELPLGTVHLQYPGLGPICRSLNVDFAPALIGFEVQAGRMVPRVDGVVVCQEYEQQVVSTYLEKETKRQEAMAKRRKAEAKNAWYQLLQAMRKRAQLEASYTNQGGPSHAAAASPAAAAAAAPAAADKDGVIDLSEAGGKGDGGSSAQPGPSAAEMMRLRLLKEHGEGHQDMALTRVTDMDVEEEEF